MFSISNVNRARLAAMQAEKGGVQINLTCNRVVVDTRDNFSVKGVSHTLDEAIERCWDKLMEKIASYKEHIPFYAQAMDDKRERLEETYEAVMAYIKQEEQS